MIPMALPLIVLGAALAQVPQGPHPQGVEHIALDMNVEVVSLLGQNLYRTPAEGDALKRLQANLAEADKNAAARPDDVAMHVQRAEAFAALWRYHDAVQAYTKAISLTPTDGALFAMRGNAFLVLRQFEQAKNDFQHATTLAPADSRGWLGLGIAHYLLQKFEDADKALAEAMRTAAADHVAEAYVDRWIEVVELRLGRPQDPNKPRKSAILSDLDTKREAYLAGVRKLAAGDKTAAMNQWRALVKTSPDWRDLSVIAAEAEIAATDGTKKMKAITF